MAIHNMVDDFKSMPTAGKIAVGAGMGVLALINAPYVACAGVAWGAQYLVERKYTK